MLSRESTGIPANVQEKYMFSIDQIPVVGVHHSSVNMLFRLPSSLIVNYRIYSYKRPGGDAFFKKGRGGATITYKKKSTLESSGNGW